MSDRHTLGDLKQMQSLPLSAKVTMSNARIKQWYEHFDGKVYISFSGGKDSTVLLHLVRNLYPDVVAFFVDTGLEYPEIRNFVKTIDNVVWLRPKMNFKEVILKYGYPVASKEVVHKIKYARLGSAWAKKFIDGSAVDNEGRPSRYRVAEKWKKLLEAPFLVASDCCDIIKKEPVKKFQKETGNGKDYEIKLADGFYIIRKLTVKECARLQTVPEWFEFPVSNTQAYIQLGNGWTVEVIAHLLKHILKEF